MTVRETAVFLGVSIQTVYLWVERKQIPRLRVMDRNLRVPQIGPRALPRFLQTGDGECLDHATYRSGSKVGKCLRISNALHVGA